MDDASRRASSGRIPRSFIDDLISRVDIVPIIDSRVKLKKTGKNYSACCPFHDEKTPSFSVSPDKQFYYCFGCGASGNAVGFLMEYERRGFIEAVQNLADYAGVEVPREEGRKDSQHDRDLAQIRDCLSFATSFYQQHLHQHPGREHYAEYLQTRGLDAKVIERYALGAAHPGWNRLLDATEERFSSQIKRRTGLFIENLEKQRTYDRFRNRIIFPIRDVRGHTLGFGGRALGDEKPKYLNSPETEVFSKGRILYGLFEARKHAKKLDSLIVTEGYMDVIALAQYGIDNAVATLGTACTADHLQLAFRYVDKIHFCFDGDKAGRTAAKRAMENALPAMEDGKQLRFLFLPDGHDPDSLVRQIGAERFYQNLDSATAFEDFVFQSVEETIDTSTMDGRARFAKACAPLIHKIPQGLYKELMLTSLAKRTGVERSVLDQLITPPAEPPNTPPRAQSGFDATKGRADGFSSKDGNSSGELASSDNQLNSDADYTPHAQSNKPKPASLSDTREDYQEPHYDYPELSGFEPDEDQADSAQFSYDSYQGQGQGQDQTPLLPDTATIFNSINTCLIFLLNEPVLITRTERVLEEPDKTGRSAHHRHPLKALVRLMAYLRAQTRPQTLPSILGYWASQYGLEAQAELASLSDRYLTLHGSYASNFDTTKQFQDAIERLYQLQERAKVMRAISTIEAKPFGEWTAQDKEQYRTLNLSPFLLNHFKPTSSHKG